MSETREFQWDVMIDLETLGVSMDAPIIAIGAWPFRLDAEPVPFKPFYVNVDAQSAAAATGGSISSFYWWLAQSNEARDRLAVPPPLDIGEALLQLSDWLLAIGGEEKAFRLWAHGPNFDLPILETSWRAVVGPELPWRYNGARDTRTLFHAMGIDWDKEFEAMEGVKHDALADARAQATMVKRAWAKRLIHAAE